MAAKRMLRMQWPLRIEKCFAAQCREVGSLLRCLDEWCAHEQGLDLYYPSHRHLTGGLRAVIDILREHSSR